MNIDLMPFAVIGGLLILAVIVLIFYRRSIAQKEDDTIHVLEDAALVPEQVAIAAKLEKVDRMGKIVTIVAVVYVLVLAALFVYQQWARQSSTVM